MSDEIKDKEPLTPEEADKIEKAFFEDGEPIRLRDGKVYIIRPLVLKQARTLIRELGDIDINRIALNFVEEEQEEKLMRMLMFGFTDYPEMDADKLSEICDLRQAKEIFAALIDLNGLKK